ncbi:MAG: MmgE/PrpD family protein [Thermoanaerobacteraceae bacterium]|nr:MmgE/PrpD family protein [Thermoanaerobacteraceae bacterium]
MISQRLAGFINNTEFSLLPAEVVEFTKLCVLDWLGSALAGSDKVPGKIITQVVAELGGAPQATVLADGSKNSCLNAALVNGAISHIVELDDVHKGAIIHPAAPVIPAALSAAEMRGKSGKELLTAVVVGYDVGIRVGEAVTPSHYYYWHTTATCGTFGANAAAGKILGLSQDQLVNSLGNAGTQAAGLWEFIEDGAMSKHLHPGKAAMNGLLAALLAEKGFTGASKIIEGKRGFCEATADDYDLGKITDGLGEKYKIMENSFKVHASCRHTHQSVDIVLDLKKKHGLNLEDVDKVVVKGYQIALNITDNPNPQTPYAAKFSTQFCVALALKYGRVGLEEFSEDNLADPQLRAFLPRVEFVFDKQLDAASATKWPGEVEIVLKDGRVVTGATDFPKGDPENPVSREELIEKFKVLAGPYLSSSSLERAIDDILNLERIADVREIMNRLEIGS